MEVNNYFLLLPVLLPIIAGILLMILPLKKREHMLICVGAVLVVDLCLILRIVTLPEESATLHLLTIMEGMNIYFHVDTISRIFALMASFVWLMAGLAAFEYMSHEKNEARFYCFYLIVSGILSALCFAGNMLTYYIFYELTSLLSMPLVMHSQDQGAIMAGLKYLFYSMAGALLVLFGLFMFLAEGNTLIFTAGGVLNGELSGVAMAGLFLMILGFGTKAGMFPMHGWLPTAHPVAPAPASAVLSGVITKIGVFGIIRTVYFVAGPDLLRGTWVQYLWIALSLVTIFMGSMLAYSEKVFKKRLAYSTVSQVSYILFGLAVMQPVAFLGAVMHVIFHSLTKCMLFLSSGAIISKTGRTRVDAFKGLGKEMPVTMWCFTLASLTLVGIPPTSAFVSKWYLAIGAMESGILVSSWLGPIVLLVSALLTAGYLLTISIQGFLPGADYDYAALQKREPGWMMLAPMVLLTALVIVFGIWPTGLMNLINEVAVAVF